MPLNGSSNDYLPSFRVCKLYQKKSEAGATYFNGRWGGAKVALVKTKEAADDGDPIWALLLSEAPAQRPDNRPSNEAKASSQIRLSDVGADTPSARVRIDKVLDDEIPF
jgi:hypothetical protein